MRRGNLVTCAMPWDFERSRPGLIVQSDHFEAAAMVTVLLLSGILVDAQLTRLTIQPSPALFLGFA